MRVQMACAEQITRNIVEYLVGRQSAATAANPILMNQLCRDWRAARRIQLLIDLTLFRLWIPSDCDAPLQL